MWEMDNPNFNEAPMGLAPRQTLTQTDSEAVLLMFSSFDIENIENSDFQNSQMIQKLCYFPPKF